ncbi:MAG: hypothetical protein IJX28_06735 [Clostridia bacterium]|nr:hypothetical protein [Clostridia bacterium]
MKKMLSCLLLILCLVPSLTSCDSKGIVLELNKLDADLRDAEEKLSSAEEKLSELEGKLEAMESALGESDAKALGYVIVTDHGVKNDGSEDVSGAIQKIIDENPNRTIYFPDGLYILANPIITPADPTLSVDLRLSNYAILRASDDWSHSKAMVRLGGKNSANDIQTPGSVYSLTGGIIDGNRKAMGVTIESGRETRVRDLSIKNTTIGMYIAPGANSNSSDADIMNVNITGFGGDKTIGVWIAGADNTLTNLRIANVSIGVKLSASANILRNVHPLYYMGSSTYADSYGFYDEKGSNWYDYCYSDQFACGFYIKGGVKSVYDNCYCYWYSAEGGKQVAMRTDGKFDSYVSHFTVNFRKDSTDTAVLVVGASGGQGVIEYLYATETRVKDKTYLDYVGKVID